MAVKPADAPTNVGETVTSPPEFNEQVDLTVVIPCYNEEASLAYLHKTLGAFMDASRGSLRLDFIFVDDGSTDATWNRLKALFGHESNCEFVQHAENLGIAAAILTGVKHGEADLVAVVDADCTFDPMQLMDMVPMMTEGIAAVAASPFHARGRVANMPRWRLTLSKGAALLYRCVLHHQFSSYTSCFRVYRRSATKDISVYKLGFCGVAEILARLDLAGYRLVECPADLQLRLLGESKINLAKTVIDHVQLIVRLAAARWLKIPLPRGFRP